MLTYFNDDDKQLCKLANILFKTKHSYKRFYPLKECFSKNIKHDILHALHLEKEDGDY